MSVCRVGRGAQRRNTPLRTMGFANALPILPQIPMFLSAKAGERMFGSKEYDRHASTPFRHYRESGNPGFCYIRSTERAAEIKLRQVSQ